MSEKPQNFENHAKFVLGFHMVAIPILMINFIWCAYQLVRFHNVQSVVSFLLSIALFLTLFYARIFALAVQDRVIRLEMRLRLQQILPTDLKPRILELDANQLVALRFASDEELPDLTRNVLEQKLTDRKAIKKMIRNWEPDHQRA
jgi:hypothetical protein